MAGINDTAVKQDETYFYYIHDDQLGSSHVLTQGKQDGSVHSGITYGEGDLLQRIEYTPFGTEKFVLNPNLKFDPRYTGQEYDIETGLYYYKARYYDPKLSRFIQPDTIVPSAKNLQAYNRYSYVVNNPLKFTDPSGHSFMSWFKKLLPAFIGALIGVVLGIVLSPIIGPLAAAVVAGFAGGFVSGAISGAISGGWRGALLGGLIGGAIGALSGLAFGGLNIGLEKGLNIVDKWARIGIMSGIGAGLSYATGGWKGLVVFGAGLAGAAVGMAATGQFAPAGKGGGMSSAERSKYGFEGMKDVGMDASIKSDPVQTGGSNVSSQQPHAEAQFVGGESAPPTAAELEGASRTVNIGPINVEPEVRVINNVPLQSRADTAGMWLGRALGTGAGAEVVALGSELVIDGVLLLGTPAAPMGVAAIIVGITLQVGGGIAIYEINQPKYYFKASP